MNNRKRSTEIVKKFVPVIGLLWITAVVFSYFHFNTSYYSDKFSTFGGFILRFFS